MQIHRPSRSLLLLELVNASRWFSVRYPNGFQKPVSESNGECDAINKNYQLDFKLLASKTALQAKSIFDPQDDPDDVLEEEGFDTDALDQTSRDFLDSAIADYNAAFHTNFDTSADKFQNYYKDLSMRVKNREIELYRHIQSKEERQNVIYPRHPTDKAKGGGHHRQCD